MNPHDAAKRPGAHLVAEEFGVEAALRDTRSGSPRVSAALSRSRAAVTAGAADPAAATTTSPTTKPSRSR
jgi:hypothetical protein